MPFENLYHLYKVDFDSTCSFIIIPFTMIFNYMLSNLESSLTHSLYFVTNLLHLNQLIVLDILPLKNFTFNSILINKKSSVFKDLTQFPSYYDIDFDFFVNHNIRFRQLQFL